jgi:hypothetical protein
VQKSPATTGAAGLFLGSHPMGCFGGQINGGENGRFTAS